MLEKLSLGLSQHLISRFRNTALESRDANQLNRGYQFICREYPGFHLFMRLLLPKAFLTEMDPMSIEVLKAQIGTASLERDIPLTERFKGRLFLFGW